MTDAPVVDTGTSDRDLARALRLDVATRSPRLLEMGEVDLGPAFEHILFTALRHPGSAPPQRGALRPVRDMARIGRAIWTGISDRAEHRPHGGVLAIIQAQVHATILAPVASLLQPATPVHALCVERATPGAIASLQPASASRIDDHLGASQLSTLLLSAARTMRDLDRATSRWATLAGSEGGRLRQVAANGIPILALAAAQLDVALRDIRPQVVVCLNEAGIWGRLVPAVAHARGTAAIDLPHAEAANSSDIAGIGYDLVAVYGPRARGVLERSGLAPDRIVEIGPLRFDALIRGARPPATGRTVVFASQPARGGLGGLAPEAKAHALRAAIAVAEEVSGELIIAPHPVESDPVIEATLATLPPGGSVRIAIERDRGLHDLLLDAWLLLTESSQSTFEAVIAGVPTITVNGSGKQPRVSFAADGISLGAESEVGAVAAARRLMDAGERRAVLETARAALERRIGPLDGRAAERAAALIRSALREVGDAA